MRSPYAEMLFEKLIARRHSDYKITSESLAVWYRNSKILEQTVTLLIADGVAPERITRFSPRHYDDYPFVCRDADLILTMTENHLEALSKWRKKSFLLSRFVSAPNANAEEIPDPFFSRDVLRIYAMLKTKVQELVELFSEADLAYSSQKYHKEAP